VAYRVFRDSSRVRADKVGPAVLAELAELARDAQALLVEVATNDSTGIERT
jgi:hypothetical protein